MNVNFSKALGLSVYDVIYHKGTLYWSTKSYNFALYLIKEYGAKIRGRMGYYECTWTGIEAKQLWNMLNS